MPDNIPTFTPPAPTFTPPTQAQRNENACYFHQNEPAVTHCARCGKPICQDCADNYQVDNDEYSGQPICYDCCQELVSDNVRQLKKQRRTIILQYIFTAIGMLFGFIIGYAAIQSEWWVTLLTTFIGGCLWMFIKNIFTSFKNLFTNIANGAWLGGIFRLILDLFLSIFYAVWGTIKKLFYYTKYIIKTSGFIRSDTRALGNMRDYMEYTQVMARNVGVDLASLMNEGSELYNNSYAQSVATNGADAAQQALRQEAITFNEHGEIIRGFAG